jgi:hypothetical protein
MEELVKATELVSKMLNERSAGEEFDLAELAATSGEIAFLAHELAALKPHEYYAKQLTRLSELAPRMVRQVGSRKYSVKVEEDTTGREILEAFKALTQAVENLKRAANRGADVHPISSKDTREAVWDLTGGVCAYCSGELEPYGKNGEAFVVEHVVPTSRGGPDNLANYVPACKTCNSSKRDSHVLEFIQRQFPARKPVVKPALVVVPVATPDEGVA